MSVLPDLLDDEPSLTCLCGRPTTVYSGALGRNFCSDTCAIAAQRHATCGQATLARLACGHLWCHTCRRYVHELYAQAVTAGQEELF